VTNSLRLGAVGSIKERARHASTAPMIAAERSVT
jgi:hypothetical protein